MKWPLIYLSENYSINDTSTLILWPSIINFLAKWRVRFAYFTKCCILGSRFIHFETFVVSSESTEFYE